MKDIQAITEKLGIKLNEMQNAAVKAILHGDKDVVILSPTGSGKPWPICCHHLNYLTRTWTHCK